MPVRCIRRRLLHSPAVSLKPAGDSFVIVPTVLLEPLLIAELALLGLATGFLAGLLGIGGGMLMVPFLTMILAGRGVHPDLAVKVAIATSMATIVFTSISSVRAHHQRGAVRWDLVRGLAPGLVLGAALASLGIFALLKGSWLALFFAVFVSFSATQMLLDKKPAPTRQVPGTAGQWAAGGVIGLLSGLVGAGGGFVSVPFMTWCNVVIHQAVATSAALGFPIALANVELQRAYRPPGRTCRASITGETTQARVCQHSLPSGRLYVLQRRRQRLRMWQSCPSATPA
jgi:uncharacterized membrane protein YfcA